MSTTSASPITAALPTRIVAGVLAGLAGGVVFGILMQMMGIIPMVAMLVGSKSVAMGWLVHLFNSALFGAIYAVLAGRWADRLGTGVPLGVAYGVAWWILGALLIMPTWLGMPVFAFNTMAWQSLMGHVIYGLLLGVGYAVLRPRLAHR
jgi:uncharacterized membrane protein YagU involved in acid resistance